MASTQKEFKTNSEIIATQIALASKHSTYLEGQELQQRNLDRIIQNIRESIKDLNIQDGDFLTSTDENHRISISPYRITMEIRFPEGMNHSRK